MSESTAEERTRKPTKTQVKILTRNSFGSRHDLASHLPFSETAPQALSRVHAESRSVWLQTHLLPNITRMPDPLDSYQEGFCFLENFTQKSQSISGGFS